MKVWPEASDSRFSSLAVHMSENLFYKKIPAENFESYGFRNFSPLQWGMK